MALQKKVLAKSLGRRVVRCPVNSFEHLKSNYTFSAHLQAKMVLLTKNLNPLLLLETK